MSNAIDIDPAVESRSSGLIPVFNPSTEEQIAEVADADQAAVDAAVARARESFESGVWRKLPAARRAEVLFCAAEIVKQRSDELAGLESKDNGMNEVAAQQIIKVANEMLIYYAGWVGKIHGESSNVVSDGLLGHYENFHNSLSSNRSASQASSSRGTGRSSSRCSRLRRPSRRAAAVCSSPLRRRRSPR
jgi:acyl-CoA reductase-like NAD-dependent aldehyde dehydrogenase